ncbi:unnamed protein product [Mytilus coruscus]|uniref:B box-type domain-containing protein n=1 Tax=Mytilus coruscus TaxID=42192 RepID=A0A6J8CGQ8_MYTCO|nr:unnamed protein product [Mytilus coruscus]
MASSIQLSYCGPCGYDDVTKEAKRWCTNCQEGLCEDCEKAHIKNKISRNHKVISIDDYRKIENVSISEVCEHHGENLEWFCKTHDKALCMVCVTSNHKSCSDVISLHIASKNARQSNALSDLVESIDKTLSNLKQCITNRELEIKKMILQMRKNKLKSTEEKLTKLREQTLHIKQFSSDIQLFLGTYQGNETIVSETKSIKDAIDTCKDYEMKVDLNSLIIKLSTEVKDFGQIKISENTSHLDFRDPKIDQARICIKAPTSRNISNIQLQLIKTFRISRKEENVKINITGCVVLPNVQKKISFDDSCWGISQENGRLYLISGKLTIQVLDLSGRQLETLKKASDDVINITTSRDNIFYTDCDSNKINCCHMNGEELWQFESKTISRPYGISVDSSHKVYVVGYFSNNLTIIQHDGKENTTLLTNSDELDSPAAVYNDREKRMLLICNQDGSVCEHHGENLEWFCKNHDKALCMVCVTSNHKSCYDVISIHIASNNARQSTALSDLVESINGTLSNLKQCITNRESASKEIEKRELEIEKMILEMRTNINTHPDKLEDAFAFGISINVSFL